MTRSYATGPLSSVLPADAAEEPPKIDHDALIERGRPPDELAGDARTLRTLATPSIDCAVSGIHDPIFFDAQLEVRSALDLAIVEP